MFIDILVKDISLLRDGQGKGRKCLHCWIRILLDIFLNWLTLRDIITESRDHCVVLPLIVIGFIHCLAFRFEAGCEP